VESVVKNAECKNGRSGIIEKREPNRNIQQHRDPSHVEDLECDNDEAAGDGEEVTTGCGSKASTAFIFATFSPSTSSQPASSAGGVSTLAPSAITVAFQADVRSLLALSAG
jgi:hypothetical protein